MLPAFLFRTLLGTQADGNATPARNAVIAGLQAIGAVVVLVSMTTEKPAFLYKQSDNRPVVNVHSPYTVTREFGQCDYYDCGRVEAMRRELYRALTERARYHAASRQIKATIAQADINPPAFDCLPEYEWLVALAELSQTMNGTDEPATVRPPCL